jgi:hypothetical protein
MPKLKVFLMVSSLLIVAGVFGIAGVPITQKTASPNGQRKVFDEDRFPIVDYLEPEPSNDTERDKQRKRSQKYDKSGWNVNPTAPSDTTVRVDSVDPKLPAFPFDRASAVIIGTVRKARGYLSNDKTGVYSAFEISIEEVLKNSSRVPFSIGSLIEAERQGGRVKFPSGRVHLYLVKEQNMPRINSRYVLFLTGGDIDSFFQILTAYELSDGQVYALDELVQPKTYDNAEETIFLSHLRSRVSTP